MSSSHQIEIWTWLSRCRKRYKRPRSHANTWSMLLCTRDPASILPHHIDSGHGDEGLGSGGAAAAFAGDEGLGTGAAAVFALTVGEGPLTGAADAAFAAGRGPSGTIPGPRSGLHSTMAREDKLALLVLAAAGLMAQAA